MAQRMSGIVGERMAMAIRATEARMVRDASDAEYEREMQAIQAEIFYGDEQARAMDRVRARGY